MRITDVKDVKSGHFITFNSDTDRFHRSSARDLLLINSVQQTDPEGRYEAYASCEDIRTTRDSRFCHVKELLQHPGDEIYETKEEILQLYPEDFI
jgi:hypothetical protein